MRRLLVAVMLVLAGCGTGPAADQNGHDYRLFVETLGGGRVSIVTTSATASITLPGGFLTADGAQLFSPGGQVFGGPAGAAGKTVVNVYDARSGALARTLDVAGAWSWNGAGTSPDGRRVVLAAPSGFVVVDTTSGKQYPVSLKGHFSFDALSNDGQHLYLIEPLAGSAYQVRLVNVFSNTLQPDAVAIKGEVEAGAMSGYKITAVADPGGHMLYSLYGRSDGRPPFIHALDLEQQFAYCIDIPAIASQKTNYLSANVSGWALSLDPGGQMLYASSSLGQVAAIDTNQFSVIRNAGLTAPPASSRLPSPLIDAAAKEFEGAPAAAAVDPGGRRLYVAWESGFLAVDTATLRPVALRDRGEHLTSLAVSSDGRHLFAVGGANAIPSGVSDLDPQTGSRLATIGGVTQPWRILRLEPSV